jgi:hypothetical protein
MCAFCPRKKRILCSECLNVEVVEANTICLFCVEQTEFFRHHKLCYCGVICSSSSSSS